MNDPDFSKKAIAARTVVGAVLALASIVFLWKGIGGGGEIGMDFPFFSGKFSTTSAGIALLVAGVILLLPRRPSAPIDTVEQRSLGQLAIGTSFYVFIGLLPLFTFIGVMIYLYHYRPDKAEYWFVILGMYTLMIQIPLLFWTVGQVSRLFQGGGKR
jgi:hypothetical protein